MKQIISTSNRPAIRPRRSWWRSSGLERTVTKIFQDTPKGRRVVGYDVKLTRGNQTVYNIAAVYKLDDGFCWRLCRGIAQAIADKPAKYLDMFAGDRHVIDLRDRQQPGARRMAA